MLQTFFGFVLLVGVLVGIAESSKYADCEVAIAGAGWSGTYFAWRLSVDQAEDGSRLFDANKICIFEATDRVGGRAYSKAGIPGMGDMRVDLGAYRFDTHSHVLVNEVIVNQLQLPTRCYDSRACNDYGNLSNVRSAYDLNAGYSTGPEGLADLFLEQGGRLFFNHTLRRVVRESSPGNDVFDGEDCHGDSSSQEMSLQFTAEGEEVEVGSVKKVFLNIPPPSMRHLARDSVMFTDTSEEGRFGLLELPKEDPGCKQWLVYRVAFWRKFPELLVGTFNNTPGVKPPLMARLHDFYGKCPVGGAAHDDCSGAVLSYYDFVMDDVEYYSKFQESLSDPYTHIALNDETDERAREMIMGAHSNFMAGLKSYAQSVLSASDYSSFEQLMNELSAPPLGTILSLFWARDADSAIRPAPSTISDITSKFMNDPNFALRNLISKPVADLSLFVANEGYSGGNGWAEPALVMTERILYRHFDSRPTWVVDVNDCLLGNVTDCEDRASLTWWAQTIQRNSDTTQFITNCQTSEDELINVVYNMTTGEDSCQTEEETPSFCQQAVIVNEDGDDVACQQSFTSVSGDFELSWSWVNTEPAEIEIWFKMPITEGWLALGVGSKKMSPLADIVLARREESGKISVRQFYSTMNAQPDPMGEESYITDAHAEEGEHAITVTFRRPAKTPSTSIHGQTIYLNQTTDIIYASFSGPLEDSEFPQHDQFASATINFGCGLEEVPTFDYIASMFRDKDQQAMLFAFDLYNFTDVKANAQGIFNVLKAKTIYGLATGMPKDKPWTLGQLHAFRSWMNAGYPVSNVSCGSSPTFYAKRNSVQSLFTELDRNTMLFMFDLWDYEDVKTHANAIYTAVKTKQMPCGAEDKWTADKVSLFNTWKSCQFPEGDPADSIAIYNEREIFYQTLNVEEHPENLPNIKKALIHWLKLSRTYGTAEKAVGDVSYRRYFEYNHTSYENNLMNIYKMLQEDGDAYNPATDQAFNTRQKIINRITQSGPFNLVDGAWISRCCPTGPIDEVHSLLFGILMDELGDGIKAHNHCQLYQELMNSVGIYTAPIKSRDFAYDQRFLQSAFTQPAYAVALAQFSDEFFPELLGTTLQIEWMVLGLVPTSKLFTYWGINPHFYNLHIGIDNAANGHGYRIKRAIEIFLDDVRTTGGDAAVQASWRRIWDGFLAFDALGTSGDDLQNLNAQLETVTPALELEWVMMNVSTFGSLNHRDKRLGDSHINDLFGDPKQFIADLADSAWVVPGHPDDSAIISYLTSFDGPMFKVFSPEDLDVWRRWIISLAPPHPVKQRGKVDSYQAMRHTVSRVMFTAMAATPHHRFTIWGPSPQNGELINNTVAAWLETVKYNPDYMMEALKTPVNELIDPFHSDQSRFYTEVIAPKTTMGTMFARVACHTEEVPEGEHNSKQWMWRDIVKRWIDDGCPMEQLPGHTFKLFLDEPVPDEIDRERRIEEYLKLVRVQYPLKSGRHFVH